MNRRALQRLRDLARDAVLVAAIGAAIVAVAALGDAARAADQTPLKSVQAPNGPAHPANFGSTDTVGVPHGGTGATTLTAHGVVVGNGATAVNVTSAGSTGQCFKSNGASADPTFQACGGGDTFARAVIIMSSFGGL